MNMADNPVLAGFLSIFLVSVLVIIIATVCICDCGDRKVKEVIVMYKWSIVYNGESAESNIKFNTFGEAFDDLQIYIKNNSIDTGSALIRIKEVEV